MKTAVLSCPSCGAPVALQPGVTHWVCEYCKRTLIIERATGQDEVVAAEKAEKGGQLSSSPARGPLADGQSDTQSELRRLQISQDIVGAQLQLGNVQAEIRALERQRSARRGKQRLQALHEQEYSLNSHIAKLRAVLDPNAIFELPPAIPERKRKIGWGCALLILALVIDALVISQAPDIGVVLGVLIAVVWYFVSRKQRKAKQKSQ